jgi:hypothetical protein
VYSNVGATHGNVEVTGVTGVSVPVFVSSGAAAGVVGAVPGGA